MTGAAPSSLRSEPVAEKTGAVVETWCPSSSQSPLVDSSAGLVDLQEEIFQKITSMKEQYLPRLVHMSQRLTEFLHSIAAEESPAMVAMCVNMKAYVSRLDHVISTLQISKEDIRPRLKERLPLYEEQISGFLDPPPRVNTDPPPQMQQACKALRLLQRNHGAF